MKKYLGFITLVSLFLLSASSSHAAFILHNTGRVTGSHMSSGSNLVGGVVVDPNYNITTSPLTSPVPATISTLPGSYLSDTAVGTNSRWISPLPNDGPTGNDPPGLYVYRMTFDLTGYSATSIVGRWLTDNAGTDIRLNGVSIGSGNGGTRSGADFTNWTTFTLNSGFAGGLNTLDFYVNNDPQTTGNPTALRVEFTAANVEAVPAPPALIMSLLGVASFGMAGLRFRRNRKLALA